MMKVLDLFSGIGGFALGLEQVGFSTNLFCEIDPHAKQILQKHWPDIPIHSDIQTLQGSFGEFDLICGGFPCQDISVAGTRKGLDGERSGLWFHYSRLIKEICPKYVIIENSPNLRNNGMRRVLQDLWESGYDAEWYCLEAAQFGAPHLRERVFIVAYPIRKGGERLVKDEYFKTVGQRGVCSSQDLQPIYHNVFGRSHRWPQPLLRRGDDGLHRRLDRLTRVGNSVYPPIVTFLGQAIVADYLRQNNKKETQDDEPTIQ